MSPRDSKWDKHPPQVSTLESAPTIPRYPRNKCSNFWPLLGQFEPSITPYKGYIAGNQHPSFEQKGAILDLLLLCVDDLAGRVVGSDGILQPCRGLHKRTP